MKYLIFSLLSFNCYAIQMASFTCTNDNVITAPAGGATSANYVAPGCLFRSSTPEITGDATGIKVSSKLYGFIKVMICARSVNGQPMGLRVGGSDVAQSQFMVANNNGCVMGGWEHKSPDVDALIKHTVRNTTNGTYQSANWSVIVYEK